jgi:hypothetical protein
VHHAQNNCAHRKYLNPAAVHLGLLLAIAHDAAAQRPALSHAPSRQWSGGNASRLASGEGRLAAWALTTSRRLTRGLSTMGRWSVVGGLGAMAIRR